MKLNYKRTLCVGFAFFLICAFWQAYNNTIPLTLTNKFGMSQTWSGVVMALDNILALFMLPLFGAISDKCKSPLGRRTPFILIGTIVAAVCFVILTLFDNMQLKNLDKVSQIDDPEALSIIYESEKDEKLLTPSGEEFVLSEVYSQEEFQQIRSQITSESGKTATNPDYTAYVVPARQAYAHQVTTARPYPLVMFMIVLLITLIAMATFRSPAVALMPDVTMKPLRSKANAIINLMGTFGGIIVLGLGIVFHTSSVKNAMMSYTGFFAVVSGIMLVSLLIFMLTVHEKQFVKEMQEESRQYGIDEADADDPSTAGTHKLDPDKKRSLIFLLISIIAWFFGYNAIISKYSVYAANILHKDYNTTLLLAQVAAVAAYLPVGALATKIGRKKTITIGVVMLTVAFFAASFMTAESSTLVMNILFALAGIAWATINVNSFPMVVEMCAGSDVGRYTGYYYTASMAAQVVTPIFSGFLMDHFGMRVLFPYAAVCAAIAIVTMQMVRHGDSIVLPEKKQA